MRIPEDTFYFIFSTNSLLVLKKILTMFGIRVMFFFYTL